MSYTSPNSIYLGSDGCLLPLVQARLVSEDGKIVESHDQSGELLLRSPSIMKGYLGDDAANLSIFDEDGWLRTGDVATFRKDAKGVEHLFIVDRKKDIIKVKVFYRVLYLIRSLNANLIRESKCRLPKSKYNCSVILR